MLYSGICGAFNIEGRDQPCGTSEGLYDSAVGLTVVAEIGGMDHRQEARDRFDRLMRVPDKIAIAACIIGMALPASYLLSELLDGSRPTYSDMMFYLSVKGAVLAVSVLYFVTSVVAAFVIAALAVRGRNRSSAHGAADLRSDTQEARQTVRSLAAGS